VPRFAQQNTYLSLPYSVLTFAFCSSAVSGYVEYLNQNSIIQQLTIPMAYNFKNMYSEPMKIKELTFPALFSMIVASGCHNTDRRADDSASKPATPYTPSSQYMQDTAGKAKGDTGKYDTLRQDSIRLKKIK
jgi:hypothetical protein